MTEHGYLLLAAIIGLAAVDIAAFIGLGIWGIFVAGASAPLAIQILGKI